MKKSLRNKKPRVYLADLVHNYIGKGPFMFPINIGYIKTYVNKFHKDIDIRLFKFPDKLIKELLKNPPDILGLSNYAWNEDLNKKILCYIKSKFPKILTVMGGPNINVREDLLFKSLKNQPDLDLYVIHKGEPGFLNIINRYLESNNIEHIKSSSIEGVAFLKNNRLIRGCETPFIKDLDIIPSPYLTGVMDEFFNEPLIPNIETNRGCPFPCTFCVWGDLDQQKIALFPFERVKKELIYIAKKVNKTKKTNILCISDANFGMFGNDLEYAKIIKEIANKYNYPRSVATFWVKNKSETIKEIANILKGLVTVDASLQSMNQETLKAIKRDNVNQQTYKEFLTYFNDIGIDSDAELILGLPYETKETHLSALRQLFDMHAGQIICYNCRILQGAQMSLPEEIEKYNVKTKFRLIDIQFGEYNGFKSFEAEEMVRSNNTLSEDDIFYFRPLHWLIQFMYNFKYYRELIEYISSNELNPVDFLVYILENTKKGNKEIQCLFEEFAYDSKNEWFSTKEELINHYKKNAVFEDLKNNGFGKLNYKYIFKTLLECPDKFDKYLSKLSKELVKERDDKYDTIINEIIKFEKLLRINFSKFSLNKPFIFERNKFGTFKYDILKWRNNRYKGIIKTYSSKNPIKYKFYLLDDQIEALNNNINQFKNVNPNFTLRKMSEYMKPSDLLYKVDYARGGINDKSFN